MIGAVKGALVCAGLFVVYGLVRRRLARRPSACDACPLAVSCSGDAHTADCQVPRNDDAPDR